MTNAEYIERFLAPNLCVADQMIARVDYVHDRKTGDESVTVTWVNGETRVINITRLSRMNIMYMLSRDARI